MTVSATAARQVELAGYRWWVRDRGDVSSIKEVVERRAYFTRRLHPEPGERWIDAGANIGAFAVVAAAAGAQVTSYEPWPESAALARRNLRDNELVGDVREQAIALDAGVGRLNLARGSQWRHSLLRRADDRTAREQVAVRVVAFEDAIAGADGCKLDIEGAEIPILGVADFGSLRKLVFEWHFDYERRTDVYHAVLARLRGLFDEVSGRKVPPGVDYRWFPAAAIVRCSR